MVGEALRPQLFLPASLNKQMLFCFWLACHEEKRRAGKKGKFLLENEPKRK